MSSYDFIIDGIRYSYSTLSGFEQCAYSFKLSKIDCLEQVQNFYAEYGSFIHKMFEIYFKGELELYQLSEYFSSNYDDEVRASPPPFPRNMNQTYYDQGLLFFDYFGFDKAQWDIVSIEDSIKFEFEGSSFVVRPDLILYDKVRKINVLVDYKTSTPFIKEPNGDLTPDKKKFNGYFKQLYTYAYAIRTEREIPINEIQIWIPRMDRVVSRTWSATEEEKVTKWISKVINLIKNEEEFTANNSNKYFCDYLCGVRLHCKYRK